MQRRRIPRLLSAALGAALVSALGIASPVRAATLVTLEADVAFDGAGEGVSVRGVIEAVSAEEMATIDTTQVVEIPFGEPVPTEPVDFVACFSNLNFPFCGVPGGDVFVYRVRLDPESGTLTEVAPNVAPLTSAPQVLGGGVVIDDDPTSVEPAGEIFVSGGRGVVFEDFVDPFDPTAHLQPGETTAILVTGWPAGTFPLADGLTFEIFIGDGTFQRFEFPVTVPEPAAGLGSALAAGLLGGMARGQRTRAPRSRSSSPSTER